MSPDRINLGLNLNSGHGTAERNKLESAEPVLDIDCRNLEVGRLLQGINRESFRKQCSYTRSVGDIIYSHLCIGRVIESRTYGFTELLCVLYGFKELFVDRVCFASISL